MGNPPNTPWPQDPGQGPQPPPGFPYGPPAGPPPPGYGMPGPGPGPGPGGPPPRQGGKGLLIGLLGGGLALVLIVVAAVAVFVTTRDDGGGGGTGPEVALTVGRIAGGAEARPGADGSLTMARPGVESPVVDVYEDFACPHCGAFDRMHDPMLKELVVAGRAKVVFRPVVIFDASRQPAHGNALRAAAALRCVGDGGRWLAYQDALYTHQPASLETEGYATADLISWAAPFGLTGDDFKKCVSGQQYAARVGSVSRGYVSAGLAGTPAVVVNGRTLGTSETAGAAELRRAIEAAR